jgi:hypothetical protein
VNNADRGFNTGHAEVGVILELYDGDAANLQSKQRQIFGIRFVGR